MKQKAALAQIHATGTTEGILRRTEEALIRKGHLAMDRDGKPVITKRGAAWLAGRLGGSLPAIKRPAMRAHLKNRKPKKLGKVKGATAKARKAQEADLRQHLQKRRQLTERALQRILGPTGHARAVKVARADGEPFTAQDIAAFTAAGWKVEAAGTAAGRVGASGLPGVVFRPDDFTFRNPDPLGPSGLARAVVLVGPVDRETAHELAAAGYDVTAAPKRLRETVRNPEPKAGKAVYGALVKAAGKRQALRADELAAAIKIPVTSVTDALSQLVAAGLAHVAGRDLFGECYAPGVPDRKLFANPGSKATAARKAEAKAAAWYQHPDLITGARELRSYEAPDAAIEVGTIVALEYESDKFDGKRRIYRHEVTGRKRLFVSTDGGTLIVSPAFRVTKRGIEG